MLFFPLFINTTPHILLKVFKQKSNHAFPVFFLVLWESFALSSDSGEYNPFTTVRQGEQGDFGSYCKVVFPMYD